MALIEITFNKQDDIEAALARLTNVASGKFWARVAADIVPRASRDLDTLTQSRMTVYPPPRTRNSPRFVWSLNPLKNARGRAGFFARYPNGYTRTGKMARSWQGGVTYDDNRFTLRVSSNAPKSSYVYGAAAFGYQQVVGHVTTGWLNTSVAGLDVINGGVVALERSITSALNEELGRL